MSDSQTALDFARHVHSSINEILAESILPTDSTDSTVLNGMKSRVEDVLTKFGSADPVATEKYIFAGLAPIIQDQFKLTKQICLRLAAGVPQFGTRMTIHSDEGQNNALFGNMSRIMARTASLKLSIDLGYSASVEGAARNFDFFADEIEAYSKGNYTPSLTMKMKEITEEAEKLLHLPLSDRKFGDRFKILDRTMGYKIAKFGTIEPPFLFVPLRQVMKLEDLLAVFDRDFLLPAALLELAKFNAEVIGDQETFQPFQDRAKELIEALKGMEDKHMAVDFVIRHSKGLVKLKRAIIAAQERPKRSRKRNKKAGKNYNKVPKRLKTSVDNGRPNSCCSTERPSAEATAVPVRACDPSDSQTPVGQQRAATIDGYVFNTCCATDDLLWGHITSKMDRSTFNGPAHSAHYHIRKHAPDMNAELYLRSGVELIKEWQGEISPRKTGREEGSWGRMVRSTTGQGLFHLREDKIIWFQPYYENENDSESGSESI